MELLLLGLTQTSIGCGRKEHELLSTVGMSATSQAPLFL